MAQDKKRLLASNKKAHFDFEITDTIEAGLVLSGPEAKSAKLGHINLTGSYAIIKNNECWLLNCHISAYPYDSMAGTAEPTRTRKLLLNRHEIIKISTKIGAKGLTLVPVEVYVTSKERVKVLLGLARGKKAPDKREDLKKKDLEREMRGKYKFR